MWFKVIHVPLLKVNGMALFPFILVRERHFASNKALVNHEKIHLRQQLELLILPFYLLYFAHYVVNLVNYRNHDRAYRNIVFEKEAYAMEHSQGYLKTRPFWAWIKFL